MVCGGVNNLAQSIDFHRILLSMVQLHRVLGLSWHAKCYDRQLPQQKALYCNLQRQQAVQVHALNQCKPSTGKPLSSGACSATEPK